MRNIVFAGFTFWASLFCFGLPELTLQVETPDGLAKVAGKASNNSFWVEGVDGIREVPFGQLKLIGDASPSLKTGYSPANYTVMRTKPDFVRTRETGEPWCCYRVSMVAHEDGNANDFWAELDLTGIWSSEDLNADEAVLLVGWWIPGVGWTFVDSFASVLSVKRFSINVTEKGLVGRPHIMLLKDGDWVAPRIYNQSVEGTLIAALHNNEPLPADTEFLTALQAVDDFQLTWLHYAAAWGRSDWISHWNRIRVGKSVKLPSKSISPMVLAAMHGHATAVAALVEAGFSPEVPDNFGYDACHFAIICGHLNVVKVLFEAGYNPNRRLADGVYAPMSLAFEFGMDDIFAFIESRGGRFNNFNRAERQNLLWLAALNGQPAMMRFILGKRVNSNLTRNNWSLISTAMASGNPKAVAVLLEHGADPNSLTHRNQPLLLEAIVRGDSDMVQLLVKHGAATDPGKRLPFGYVELAAVAGHAKLVNELLQAGLEWQLPPEVAPDLLLMAIINDIPIVADRALESSGDPEFLFHGFFPIGWVIDYYGTNGMQRWWTARGADHYGDQLADAFVSLDDLDDSLAVVQVGLPEFEQDLFERYGKIETRVRMVVDEDGSVRFPRFAADLPQAIRMLLHSYVSDWKFHPPKVQGNPARVIVTVPIILDRPQDRVDALELNQVSSSPVLIRQTPPVYPASLIKSGVSGEVTLLMNVDISGNVADVEVLRFTHPLLANAASKAARLWLFEPAIFEDKPTATRIIITIPFQLRR